MTWTTGDIITRASDALADQCAGEEFTAWSKSFLLGALSEAYASVAKERPDAFAQTKSVTLASGSTHSLEDATLVKALTSDGSPVSEEGGSRSYDMGSILSSMYCARPAAQQGGTITLRSVKINPNDPKSFTVEPPIPEGSTAELTATVHGSPPCVSEDDWDQPIAIDACYASSLIEFVLYRAYSRDTADTTSARIAQSHHQAYMQGMERGYTRYSQFNSGFYGGEEGDGDPQVVRR